MGKKSSAPKSPDPRQTAAAQTGTNIATAIANAYLGNISQTGPTGSIDYSQVGDFTYTDPATGESYTIPRFQAETTLGPGQEELFANIQQAATDVSGRLGDEFQLGDEATEARLFDLGRQRLDPVFAQRRQGLEQQLANQGVTPGSEAYNRALTQLNQQESDAYNQLLLSGRGQAVQEQIAEQTLPINELTALLGGQQVSTPQFSVAQQPQIATTDYAGLVNQNFQNQLGVYNQQQQAQQGLLGGLFGLGGSLLGGAGAAGGFGTLFSDTRLKKCVQFVAKMANGLNLYRFRYIFGGDEQFGVMAQEIIHTHPEAVSARGGYLTVNYDMLGVNNA